MLEKLIRGLRRCFSRLAELSTTNTCVREGTDSDWTTRAPVSGASCFNRESLALGGFLGRFVSVLIIRCEARRWLSAATT